MKTRRIRPSDVAELKRRRPLLGKMIDRAGWRPALDDRQRLIARRRAEVAAMRARSKR